MKTKLLLKKQTIELLETKHAHGGFGTLERATCICVVPQIESNDLTFCVVTTTKDSYVGPCVPNTEGYHTCWDFFTMIELEDLDTYNC